MYSGISKRSRFSAPQSFSKSLVSLSTGTSVKAFVQSRLISSRLSPRRSNSSAARSLRVAALTSASRSPLRTTNRSICSCRLWIAVALDIVSAQLGQPHQRFRPHGLGRSFDGLLVAVRVGEVLLGCHGDSRQLCGD